MALKLGRKRKKLVQVATGRATYPRTSPGKARAVKKAKPKSKRSGELISKEQAIAEFGEEGGPMLYRLINSSEKEPPASPATRLRDAVAVWANEEELVARFMAYSPGVPGRGEIERALELVQKEFEQERWTVLVFRPGRRAPVIFPTASAFPPSDCALPDVLRLASQFQPRRYWGEDFDSSDFEVKVRWGWREKRQLPKRLDELLTALAHFAGYASQVGPIPADEEAYLRALMEAARSKTVELECEG